MSSSSLASAVCERYAPPRPPKNRSAFHSCCCCGWLRWKMPARGPPRSRAPNRMPGFTGVETIPRIDNRRGPALRASNAMTHPSRKASRRSLLWIPARSATGPGSAEKTFPKRPPAKSIACGAAVNPAARPHRVNRRAKNTQGGGVHSKPRMGSQTGPWKNLPGTRAGPVRESSAGRRGTRNAWENFRQCFTTVPFAPPAALENVGSFATSTFETSSVAFVAPRLARTPEKESLLRREAVDLVRRFGAIFASDASSGHQRDPDSARYPLYSSPQASACHSSFRPAEIEIPSTRRSGHCARFSYSFRIWFAVHQSRRSSDRVRTCGPWIVESRGVIRGRSHCRSIHS